MHIKYCETCEMHNFWSLIVFLSVSVNSALWEYRGFVVVVAAAVFSARS